MRKKDVHAAVAAKIDLGYDRQHVYDEMCLEQPDLAGKKLADAVRWTPPLAARQHYRTEHTALLAAIAANVLLPLLHGQADSGLPSFYGPGFFTVLPFATIGLGIALARYRLQVLPWLIFFTMVGACKQALATMKTWWWTAGRWPKLQLPSPSPPYRSFSNTS
jgi:hypothetical protein